MYLLDGHTLDPYRYFVHGDIQYPANWLAVALPEQRAAIGIIEVPDIEDRYEHFQIGWSATGEPIWQPLADAITAWVHTTKCTARNMLQDTDWYIIRQVETGNPIPVAVTTWRTDIRAAAAVKTACITAACTTQALADYISSAAYTTWPSDPRKSSAATVTHGLEPTVD